MRDFILSEIARVAAERKGVAPGQEAFAKASGITPAKWRGIYWLRWSEALSEAGFEANAFNIRSDSTIILKKLANLSRSLGRLPIRSEIKMQRRLDPDFPNLSTVGNHFPTNASLIGALRTLASNEDFADLIALLPSTNDTNTPQLSDTKTADGVVYLLKMGPHYKIGNTNNIERRIRQITVAMPEPTTLIHSIRTDDPSGIEAYWHRRFASRRVNGEWFRLGGNDLRAFRRRTFQ